MLGDTQRCDDILQETRSYEKHMDHISETKGQAPDFHDGVVHKHILFKQYAMTIPDAKATVDQSWDKLETYRPQASRKSRFKKVTPKSQVVQQAKQDGRSVHFAFLMDFGHLKHLEFAKHLQTYKGSVVQGRENVEHDSGNRTHRAGRISFASGGSKIVGYNLQAPWHRA